MRRMDPREYRFVQEGPVCVCGHDRIDHVSLSREFDVVCETGCGCVSYWPSDDVDYVAMRLIESVEEGQVAEMSAQVAFRRAMWLAVTSGAAIGWLGPAVGAVWYLTLLATVVLAGLVAWWSFT